jgi:hypothetical protein
MNPTDDLPRAVANWVSMVIQQLSAEQTEVLRSCLEAPGPDVRVVFCMREGAVLLEVSKCRAAAGAVSRGCHFGQPDEQAGSISRGGASL